MTDKPETVDLETLALSQLALFVGSAADAFILEAMGRAGFAELRPSHGYLIQHVIEAPRPIGEIAKRLGVTQQAVSKSVSELETAGVLETLASEDDARVRRVGLSARGKRAVATARALRAKLERRLERRCGEQAFEQARRVLIAALDELGGVDAVRARRVRPPS
jgi:DNA-binding MarR family transcriptional regulator